MSAATGQKTYTYRAREAGGKLVKGSVQVQSEALAVSRLVGMGLSPVQVPCMRHSWRARPASG